MLKNIDFMGIIGVFIYLTLLYSMFIPLRHNSKNSVFTMFYRTLLRMI